MDEKKLPKVKVLTPAHQLVHLVMQANIARHARGRIQRSPANTLRGRQATQAKGTGTSLEKDLDKNLSHVGKKQIAKELRRREKEKKNG